MIMKQLFIIISFIFITLNGFGQNHNLNELVSQGITFHDEGKYDEAIAKYKMALEIDNKSTLANYELSFTYFITQQYKKAIKHSKIALKQSSGNQHESYIVLGSSLDLINNPSKAIKTYEKGLSKFPNSNLLNYNIALTYYNQQDYKKAEKHVINAIIAKPTHASSHIILSAIMQDNGQRVKSILPLYYSLLIEPNSNRSLINYNSLRKQLDQGVKKQDAKNINVSVPFSSSSDEFGAAEMMISLLAASKYTEESKGENDLEMFVKTNKGIFNVLGELKKDNTGFWWDLYVDEFYNLVKSNNIEAFSYYISQSTDNEEVNNWIIDNPDKMEKFTEWKNK